MKTNENFERELLQLVGGSENVISATHCMTRLRLRLKDENKAKTDDIKKMKGVINVLISNGQYQIVIGTHVTEVYSVFDTLLKESKGGEEKQSNSSEEEVQKNKNIFAILLDVISSVFTPTLGLLAGSGIIKGLASLLAVTNVIQKTDGAFILLQNIGNTFFYFFPVVLGYTAAKKFQLKPMLGLAVGAAMCYPGIQLSALSGAGEPLLYLLEGTMFQSPVYIDFFGIPIISVDYTGTVIPVILAVWFASRCEKLFNRIVPDLVKFFFVPMLTLLVTLPVAFLFLGPVATFGSTLISEVTLGIRSFSPMLAGAVVGLTWQILVIFGMHWGFIPVYINNVMTLGYDNVMMPFFACTFATSAVVAALFIKTKDKKSRKWLFPILFPVFSV